MNKFNWDEGFTLDFDLKSGRSENASTTKRYLSQMKEMYLDQNAAMEMLEKEDELVYEFYELGCPEREGDLAFGTTILYPGKVGSEYFMTKGHFHTKLETAEVYYAMQGEGLMLLENSEGDWSVQEMKKGEAVYVPRGYAHRSINVGNEPLVLFFTFAGDAGHDYGTIETKGYRKLVVEKNNKVEIASNPKWEA